MYRRGLAKRAAVASVEPGSAETHLTLDRQSQRTLCGLTLKLIRLRREDFEAGRCAACAEALAVFEATGHTR
jgi:hypothetical protein